MKNIQPTMRPCGTRSIPDIAFAASFQQSKLARGFLPVLIALGMSAPVHAGPLWDVDFSSDTAGFRPSTNAAVAGVVNTRPTGITAQTGASVLVEENFTAGAASLTNNPVVFTTPTGANVGINLHGAEADYQAGTPYKLSFDFLIDGQASPSNGAMLQAQMLNTNNIPVAKFILEGDGSLRIDTMSTDEGGVFNQTFADRWEKDTVMSAELIFSPSDNTFTVKLSGGSGGPTADSAAIGGNPDDRGVLNLQIGRASSNVGWTGAVDNIVVAP